MTLAAIVAKLGFVRIPVAVSAVLEPYPSKLLEFFSVPFSDLMAFNAFYLKMLAFQWVFCCCMIELFSWFKGRIGMALQAIGWQSPLMVILMA